VEKRWLTYQLLAALEQAHSKGICHGDIKSENVLVTSWNWLVLADFGPYKPVRLPAANDVAVLYYFFEPHKGRAACNLAPERFVGEPSDRRSTLSSVSSRPSMSSGTPVPTPEPATIKLPTVCEVVTTWL
jgi:phosphoinositide-3-kinase, regulatory subunit 4